MPKYEKSDNVYQRLARLTPLLDIAFDQEFHGTAKNGAKIDWDYVSIHKIRSFINSLASDYGLNVRTKAQPPIKNTLPEYAEEIGGTTIAVAWQNAIVTNIDNPRDTICSDPTRGDAVYRDDKSLAKAKQQAAKTGLIMALNLSFGAESDAEVNHITDDDRGAARATGLDAKSNVLVKLQPAQIARFRELLAEHQLDEAVTLAEVTGGQNTRIEQPIAPHAIRKLMEHLKVDPERITDFISRVVGAVEQPPVPTPAVKNARHHFKRKFDTLAENAQRTFAASIGLKLENVPQLNDEQATSLIPKLDTFIRSQARQTPPREPASLRAIGNG